MRQLTGITNECRICKQTKDDALFKYQNGKRAGMVCIVCDLQKKRDLYKSSEKEQNRAKLNAKEWRENNLEKAIELSRAWREKNNEYILKIRKIYHIENANRINAKSRKWYRENTERSKANSKQYQETHKEEIQRLRAEYYQENKQRLSQQNAEWRKNNQKLMNSYLQKYNLAKLKRTPVWADIDAIKEFYKSCPDGYEVDHIHPIQGKLISGFHVLENLQYLTTSENQKKSAKFKPYWVFYEPSRIRIEII